MTSFHSSLRAILPVVLVCACGASSSLAQVSGLGATTQFFPGAGVNIGPIAAFQNGVITGSKFTTVTTGDGVLSYPNSSPLSSTSLFRGFDFFRVQPLPTEVSNFKFSGNYKMVNSGGGDASQLTILNYQCELRQAITFATANPTDPIIMSCAGASDTLSGNGFTINSFSLTSPATPYVLTPGYSYYFQINIFLSTSIPAHGVVPFYGNALEFGGPLTAGSFTGFESSFDYRTVPTPGLAGTLALAGLLGSRRRR